MTDTTTVVAVPTGDRSTNFDWAAVAGGTLVASALSFVLFSFGTAAGIASVSPYSWNNPSVTTLSLIGAAWFCIVMLGSFLVGGFFAGRFRRTVGDAPVKESEARDGAHGLLVWALGLLIGLCLASMVASMAARTAASAAGGAASVAAQTVPTDRVSSLIDTMLRPGSNATNAPLTDNPRADISRVLNSSALTKGEISNEDRDYIARIVSARTALPQDEARKRVDATIEQAKQAANAARKTAASLAFLIGAISMLAAGAAYWGATAGGKQRRDEIW
jgi:hypothetical protein